ncbi:NADPH-dependent FMN reductase [Kangiella koreensis]|uniref:NADPH-dependent FMN reductase n=1 Tax=Kangiella koreensis (strain DSM 16069 / JCM 12317 / KCTC 12182 / SW-125) TaxID=523791 RepID=C7R6L9_KANKD|nr:NAD(P)H-dependent oxidoreductase [Kangiella koreensis]ACV25535.1 NADPH-dependent FMN reductase [Kangiella koreensis DSM 16069]
MKYLLFLGTVRDSTPPKPARLGLRVVRACLNHLQEFQSEHEVELIDPMDYDLSAPFKPHFSYAKGQAPKSLDELAEKIKQADAYIMVSPEYNHTMSPALSHLLNHFGSSQFSYKPSVIVTYSAGQWGGVRAAMSMRGILSELGCLPVSAMTNIPKAQEVFTEDGDFEEGENVERWNTYLARGFLQLEWWAQATKQHRAEIDPDKVIQAFKKDPSQRNAPEKS